MLRHPFAFLSILLGTLVSAAGAPLMETWETGYTGKDASGPQVMGYWKYDDHTDYQNRFTRIR